MLQVQKTGHLTDDNASRTELHNLADRFHTVLTHPIDTKRLAGKLHAGLRAPVSAYVTCGNPAGGMTSMSIPTLVSMGAGPEVTTEIQQSAARIAGEGRHEGTGMGTGMGAATGDVPTNRTATTAQDTAEPGIGRDMAGPPRRAGLDGNANAPVMGDRVSK